MSGTVGTPSGNRSITFIELGVAGFNVAVSQAWIGTAGGNRLVFGESVTLPASISVNSFSDTNFVIASVTFESDGDIKSFSSTDGTNDIGNWVAPKTDAPGLYEIRATLLGGNLTSTTPLNEWLALTSNIIFRTSSSSGSGFSYADVLIEIRLASVVLDSCVLFLESISFRRPQQSTIDIF